MEAIVADHMGTEKCPWSAAEMKGMNKRIRVVCRVTKRAYCKSVLGSEFAHTFRGYTFCFQYFIEGYTGYSLAPI